MRALVARVLVLVVIVVGVSWLTFASARRADAQASCTGVSTFFNSAGWPIEAPTLGYYTDNPDCLLGPGNASFAVKALQWDLNQCYGANLAIDGIFGPLTEAALTSAQYWSGTVPDGIYGPNTFSSLSWVTDMPGWAGNPATCRYIPPLSRGTLS